MSIAHPPTVVLLPHQKFYRQRRFYRLDWRRLSIVSGICAVMSFVFVYSALNAPLSKEQSFINQCRKLGGLVIRDPKGAVMDNKLICLRREALLGWQARD